MTTQLVNARIDSKLKKEVDSILSEIGLTGSEAIRLFYTQVRNKRGIPFALVLDEQPNAQVQKAMQNVMNYLDGKNKKDFKSFSSVDEMMDDLLLEDEE